MYEDKLITERPYPGSVTEDQLRLGMVIRHHTTFLPDVSPKVYVVVGLPDLGKFYTVTPEQAARFTAEEIEGGKLDGLGQRQEVYGFGIGPDPLMDVWCGFSYCTDETPA